MLSAASVLVPQTECLLRVKWRLNVAMSAFPQSTDIVALTRQVRKVPEPDVLTLSGTETIVRLVRS
jgi:hypothetical protein